MAADRSIDFTTPAGAKLRARLEDRLVELRLRNDDPSLDAIATAELRGRISEVKALLAGPIPVVTTPGY